ncbi:MAG TPA: ribose-phosphate pyrophosphokinase [Aestuariivirgaceae bacterium]|jgi:ribose-phosphate pyrophosphokinase
MILFAPKSSAALANQVAVCLGTEMASLEEREFEDGEQKTRPLVSVRGRDVYVFQSLHGGPTESTHDKLCRLLFLLATMRENGAARTTAIVPYLAYSRKDRQTKSRDPVTSQYIARLFEAVGTNCVVTLDVHNIVAFQNAFRCTTIHLDTRRLFCQYLLTDLSTNPLVVASPDPGGVKRAQLFRETLEKLSGRPIAQAFIEKRRSGGVVSGDLLVGDVKDSLVLVIDDLIASGGTMARAARASLEQGAKEVIAVAAHGLFTGDAQKTLAAAPLLRTIVSDTVPPFRLDPIFVEQHIEIVSAAPLFAEAIKRLHFGGSISELLEGCVGCNG